MVKDDDRIEQALDDALRTGASEKWIRQTLERVDRAGPSGTVRLRRVFARPDRAGRLPDSIFERLVERATRSDKQRDMWLKRAAWQIEYPTWEEAKQPDEFVAMIESLYRSRVRVPRRAS